ncbi:hypothetical protein C2E23DRAFT_880353 [Lenzites betulinus]|nr:hypothetical protein C2E23DRAFT_880352 [Lenzites betulinus]KAH9858954.1 hypothetical protein C2E23DRAFT_880353 [Lenzites betulinus]
MDDVYPEEVFNREPTVFDHEAIQFDNTAIVVRGEVCMDIIYRIKRLLNSDLAPPNTYTLDSLPRQVQWSPTGVLTFKRSPMTFRTVAAVAAVRYDNRPGCHATVHFNIEMLREVDRVGANELLALGGVHHGHHDSFNIVYILSMGNTGRGNRGLFDGTQLIRPPLLSVVLPFTTVQVGDLLAVNFDCRIVGDVGQSCEIQFNMLYAHLLWSHPSA